jgi:hypothetical protein
MYFCMNKQVKAKEPLWNIPVVYKVKLTIHN